MNLWHRLANCWLQKFNHDLNKKDRNLNSDLFYEKIGMKIMQLRVKIAGIFSICHAHAE
jgi:hypothetical protein